MVPQYIQQSGGTPQSDADIIQITFKRSVISQRNAVQKMMDCLRMLATHFTQKYATFLDGFISIPTQFNAETFIRSVCMYVHNHVHIYLKWIHCIM